MGAFLIAGIIFLIGVFGWLLNIAAYMSLDAPSVQGDPSEGWVWLIGGTILALLVAATHWLPHVSW